MPNILLPMDMHNVFRECDYEIRGLSRHANAKVDAFMEPLINELTRRRPAWTFVSRNSAVSNDGTNYFYTRFEVRVGDETIGLIDQDINWRTSEKSYEFDCRQLKTKRSRGTATRTKDLKKAVKLIIGSFNELSYVEHAHKANTSIRNTAYRQVSAHKYTFSQLEGKARPHVMSFLSKHWSEFVGSIPGVELQSELSEMLNVYEEAAAAAVIYEAVSVKGAIVKLLNDKYIVSRVGSDEIHTYTNQTLPNDLRGGIGALKLVSEDTTVSGIGVRSPEGAFYVLPNESGNE